MNDDDIDLNETDTDGEYRLEKSGECDRCGEHSDHLFMVQNFWMCSSCEEEFELPSSVARGLVRHFLGESKPRYRVLDFLMDYPNQFFSIEQLKKDLSTDKPLTTEEIAQALDELSKWEIVIPENREAEKWGLCDSAMTRGLYAFEHAVRREEEHDSGYKIRTLEEGRDTDLTWEDLNEKTGETE